MLQMAPEQGPDSKSTSVKQSQNANEGESSSEDSNTVATGSTFTNTTMQSTNSVSNSIPPTQTQFSNAETISIVHKWDIRFTGQENLMEFLERVEELAESYQIDKNCLLPVLPTILNGNALKWYRVRKDKIFNWQSFRNELVMFFLPKRYFAQIEQSFYNRKQHNRERAKDYILEMLTLARQHPMLKSSNHLERLYDGLRVDYRHYIRRNDFNDLNGLMDLVEEFELLKQEECRNQRLHVSHMLTEGNYNRDSCCWRCGEYGHRRWQCKNPPKLFCSYCRRGGMLTKICDCRSEKNKISNSESEFSDDRCHIKVNIYGSEVDALIDTGACRTYIDDAVKHLLIEHNVKPQTTSRRIQMADQTMTSCVEDYPIKISYRGLDTMVVASVIPTLAEPIILGMDFLRMRNFRISIDNEPLPMSEESTATVLQIGNISEVAEPQSKFSAARDVLFPSLMPFFTSHQGQASEVFPQDKMVNSVVNSRVRPTELTMTKSLISSPHLKVSKASKKSTRMRTNSTEVDTPSKLSAKTSGHPLPLVPLSTAVKAKNYKVKFDNPVAAFRVRPTGAIGSKSPIRPPNPTKHPIQKVSIPTTMSKSNEVNENIFDDIKIRKPGKYMHHQQYLIRRNQKPAVKVTVLTCEIARLRCAGFTQIVQMI